MRLGPNTVDGSTGSLLAVNKSDQAAYRGVGLLEVVFLVGTNSQKHHCNRMERLRLYRD